MENYENEHIKQEIYDILGEELNIKSKLRRAIIREKCTEKVKKLQFGR